MTRIALIAGTYAPDRCGVAHYTDRLRIALSNQAIEFVVLTTIVAANEPTVRGVVNDWHLRDLISNNNELESAPIRMINPHDVEGLTNLLMNPISRHQLGLASQNFSRQFS